MTPTEAGGFPVTLRLSGRPVLVVGGGSVATRKVRALVDAGAHVTVVAPAVADELRAIPGIEVCNAPTSGARWAPTGWW